ncbi:MAG: hypothetical protein KAI25_11955, partial [Hyphomicrobiaceae bacterium]|nr:hypothetical protein [Hyphomicrobiaceae bacterium]
MSTSDQTVTILQGGQYHRNGITGEGFEAFLIRQDGGTYLATIGYDENGEKLDATTCRVVDPLCLEDTRRGDYVGEWLIE